MAQSGHGGRLGARLLWVAVGGEQAAAVTGIASREEVARVRSDTTSVSADRHPAARPASPPNPRYRAVHDRVALDEIELYAELIIAAERSEKPLSQKDIDRILGLTVRA
jgi:hypothetical protein